MKGFLVAFVALASTGCGSSEDDRPFTDCGSLTGGFQVTEKRESGTCPESTDPFSINLTAKPDQTVEVEFVEFDITCGGPVNSCNVRGNCPTRAGMPEMITGNVSIDLTIAPASLQGSYNVTLNPNAIPDIPDGCNGRFKITGTRR